MRALTLAASLHLAFSFTSALAGDNISVETARRDGVLEVVCRATVEAPPDLVWATLTDYGHLADFIPGLRSSRVVSREGAVAVVEQTGDARFLFFTYPIEVTIVSTERPPYRIEAGLRKGTLKRMDGAYSIVPQAAGHSIVSWTGIVEAESMPPLIGEILMRSLIEDQFRGMVREIERRDILRRKREAER